MEQSVVHEKEYTVARNACPGDSRPEFLMREGGIKKPRVLQGFLIV